MSEIGTQSKEFVEVETQTVDQRPSVSDAANPLEDPKFYKFVMRAVPLLERELELAARSRAFDGYKLLEDEADLGVQKLHVLDNNNNSSSSNMNLNSSMGKSKKKLAEVLMKVSCLTWSNAGSTIAVCYEQVQLLQATFLLAISLHCFTSLPCKITPNQ